MEEQKLSRKELVEYIRKNMPENLSELEKLAYIEVEVAKHISFDEKYIWGDIGTKEKIYKLAKEQAKKPAKEIKRKIICVTMAELFGYVLKELGFDVKYQTRAPGHEIKAGDNDIFKSISDKKQEHVCVLVGLSNGNYIETDIQDDLARLQTRSRPKAFGADRHGTKIENGVKIEILDKNMIENTFKKVYNLQEQESFTNKYIMTLRDMLKKQNRTPIQMLEFFMTDPRIEKELQNTRCIEANKLYKAILYACYSGREEKLFYTDDSRATIEECILQDNDGRKRYSFCIYAEDEKEKIFYVYSKKSRRMVKLTLEEIQKLKQSDVKIKLRGFATEARVNLIKFINSKGEQSEENVNPPLSLEDIFIGDEEELE